MGTKAFYKRDFERGERLRDPAGADGTGYASNGESEFTRVSAHGGISAPRRDPAAPRKRFNGYMPSDEKIRQTQIMIGTLESKLMFEQRIDSRSPKIAKLEKDLRIKRAFLTQLGRERNDPNYIREKIRV
jgi:hypothetical protein